MIVAMVDLLGGRQGQLPDIRFQKALHQVRPSPVLDSEYLALHLRATSWSGELRRYFTGATINHFTGKALHSYVLALLPFPEQERVVTKINELMALCDELELWLMESSRTQESLASSVTASIAGG